MEHIDLHLSVQLESTEACVAKKSEKVEKERDTLTDKQSFNKFGVTVHQRHPLNQYLIYI